jgi:hypothetical protein
MISSEIRQMPQRGNSSTRVKIKDRRKIKQKRRKRKKIHRREREVLVSPVPRSDCIPNAV